MLVILTQLLYAMIYNQPLGSTHRVGSTHPAS